MADWVRTETPDGGVRVDITRLTDDSVMCCLCFEYKRREELHGVEPGVRTDVCETCWKEEDRALAARGLTREDVFGHG